MLACIDRLSDQIPIGKIGRKVEHFDSPKELVPLAKLSPDDPTTVEVFELCINGQEIAPGYTEQNNLIEQRERLEHEAGGEQQKLDEDFRVALEHGMRPA